MSTDNNNAEEAAQTSPPLSYVMMRNPEFPPTENLLATIKERVPEFEPFPSDGSSKDEVALMGMVDGKICAIMLIDAPNPIGPNESFIQSAWWWPNAQQDLEHRKSHAIITVMAGEKTIADHTILARITAALVETNDTIGVIWNGADAVWQADLFLGIVNQAGSEPPYAIFVSVKLGRDTQFPAPNGDPAWLGMTFGLSAFGLMEIEVRGFPDQTPEPMITNMQDIASYLMSSGPVINDGDTIGPNEQTKIKIKFESSTLNPDSQVYRLYLNE